MTTFCEITIDEFVAAYNKPTPSNIGELVLDRENDGVWYVYIVIGWQAGYGTSDPVLSKKMHIHIV